MNLETWLGTIKPYDILLAEFVDNQLKQFMNDYVDRTRLNIHSPSRSSKIDTMAFEKRIEYRYEELLNSRKFLKNFRKGQLTA